MVARHEGHKEHVKAGRAGAKAEPEKAKARGGRDSHKEMEAAAEKKHGGAKVEHHHHHHHHGAEGAKKPPTRK